MVVEFLFFKGMTGALAPFSYLVFHNTVAQVLSVWDCLYDGQSDLVVKFVHTFYCLFYICGCKKIVL
jgi:hypothetical protein